jgi:short-subunit dehydrogenase
MSTGKQSKTAVVTGAAGGLGACFAKKLAEQGYSLLLTDRCPEQIEQLRKDLAATNDIRIETCATDLANDEELESLARRLSEIPDLELLINNAGFATMGHFAEVDVRLQMDMIRVHVMAPTRLARAVLPGMLARDRGAIVNVSSLGAWLPQEGHVQYSSTKACLVVFSQALREELAGTHVQVQVLCPGFVRSGFHESETMAGFDKSHVPKGLWTTPELVVDYSLKSLRRNRLVAIPGWKNRLLALAMRAIVLKPLANAVMRAKT